MKRSEELQLERARRGLTLLYEVSRAAVSNRYLEEILSLVVGLTAEVIDSKICSLMLLDEKKQELVIQTTQSLSEAYRSKPPLKVSESVSGRAVQMKHPIMVQDVRVESGYQFPDLARREGLVSLVAVPMWIKDRIIGVLNCYSAEERKFTAEEIQLLQGVANQAALTIENTRLLAEKVAAQETLEIRKKVERAKGILMKRHGVEEIEAYRRLQKQSMDKRRSLKEVAEAIIISEEIAN